MAKKRGDVNVSQKIRDYAAENNTSKPKLVCAGLAKEGIKTSPQYVSMILSKARAGKGKPDRRKGTAGGSKLSGNILGKLVMAEKMAKKMGGIDNARAALDALAKLLS